MNIREAKHDPWLLSADAYEIYSQCMYKPAYEKYKKEMTELAEKPLGHVFVCSDAAGNAGIISLEEKDHHEAEITGIAVLKEKQRRGIGRFMIRASALSLHAECITAETDDDAAAFYAHTGFATKKVIRHFPDCDAVRYECTLDMSSLPDFELHSTAREDLEGVRSLWADGEVMKYVGFPDGLRKSPEEMLIWLTRIGAASPRTAHYSLYYRGVYCGESYYSIEGNGVAALDIKLFPFARGRGIASRGLKYAIDQAFANGAVKCYVDPNPENAPALALYRRLGMVQKEMPQEIYNEDYPDFLYFEIER